MSKVLIDNIGFCDHFWGIICWVNNYVEVTNLVTLSVGLGLPEMRIQYNIITVDSGGLQLDPSMAHRVAVRSWRGLRLITVDPKGHSRPSLEQESNEP